MFVGTWRSTHIIFNLVKKNISFGPKLVDSWFYPQTCLPPAYGLGVYKFGLAPYCGDGETEEGAEVVVL